MKTTWSKYWPWMVILGLALILTPLASSNPDGLERVLETLGLSGNAGPLATPLADYQVRGVNTPGVSIVLAGLIGAGGVLGLTYLIGLAVCRNRLER